MATAASWLWCGAAEASTVVEVGANVAHWVEPPVVRRLVQLEVDDVDVPTPPGAKHHSVEPGLYVRVIFHEARLIVELWDRGELQGRRLLSPSGGKPLTARRIALASGELASRLRERRLFEARKYDKEQARLAAQRRKPKLPKLEALPVLSGAANAGYVHDGGALLFGPTLRGGLRLGRGLELAMGVGLLSGGATHATKFQVFELQFSPGYWFRPSPYFELRVGLNSSAGVVHLLDGSVWSSGGWESETWWARATSEVRGAWALSESVHVEAALEGGALLRKVWVRTSDGERAGLGGAWLGASVGVTLL